MANEDTSPVQRLAGPTAAGVPGRACEVGELLGLIAALREHCPWMGALTHESLVEYLLEEAYEVAETIETGGGDAELKSELGLHHYQVRQPPADHLIPAHHRIDLVEGLLELQLLSQSPGLALVAVQLNLR